MIRPPLPSLTVVGNKHITTTSPTKKQENYGVLVVMVVKILVNIHGFHHHHQDTLVVLVSSWADWCLYCCHPGSSVAVPGAASPPLELWPPLDARGFDDGSGPLTEQIYFVCSLNDLSRRWSVETEPHDARLDALRSTRDEFGHLWYLLPRPYRVKLSAKSYRTLIEQEKIRYNF